MHRKIAEQIESVIVNSPWADKVGVFVHKTESDGFWAVAVHTTPKSTSYLNHVLAFSKTIGQAYGEGLSHELDGRWLVLQ